MKAYRELSRSRITDQGVGRPIPIEQIRDYCDFFRITSMELKEDLFLFLGRMDNTYMAYIQKKMEQERNTKP